MQVPAASQILQISVTLAHQDCRSNSWFWTGRHSFIRSLRKTILQSWKLQTDCSKKRLLHCSAINGCGVCLDAHEEELRKRDWPATHVQAGLRIAAVIAATATVLRAEAA